MYWPWSSRRWLPIGSCPLSRLDLMTHGLTPSLFGDLVQAQHARGLGRRPISALLRSTERVPSWVIARAASVARW